MTSVRKSCILKCVKRIETITCRNVLKYILGLDEESKRHLVLVTFEYFIELLAFPVLLLYELRPQCWYVLSNLATKYTSTWNAGRTSVFTLNQIRSIVLERVYSVTEQI